MEITVNLIGSEHLVEVTNMEVKSFSKNAVVLYHLIHVTFYSV